MVPCDDLSGLEAGRCNEKRRRGDLEASAPFHPRRASILGGEHGPMLEHTSFCLLDWLLGPVFRNWFISYWFIIVFIFLGGGILEKIILGGATDFYLSASSVGICLGFRLWCIGNLSVPVSCAHSQMACN